MASRDFAHAVGAIEIAVNYPFIIQVSRNTPFEDVFVRTAFAAALIRADLRVVALRL